MSNNLAVAVPEIEFRAVYIHEAQNKTGAFGVHPDDIERLEAWRIAAGNRNKWNFATDPASGVRLHAFSPVEGNLLDFIEKQLSIRHGERCHVTYRAVPNRERVELRIDRGRIRKITGSV